MQTAAPLSYASPLTASSRSYWPEAILAALTLGLVFFGGCFLIGVGKVYNVFSPSNSGYDGPKGSGEIIFVIALYVCVALCFAGAAGVGMIAVKRLAKA